MDGEKCNTIIKTINTLDNAAMDQIGAEIVWRKKITDFFSNKYITIFRTYLQYKCNNT